MILNIGLPSEMTFATMTLRITTIFRNIGRAAIANGDYDADAMNSRWSRVDEDRLKIHFRDKQTLYLRFMVDLKEMEHKRVALADDPDLMHHIGTHTKLWCRCIARVRGAANLKQDLPHFDKNDTDEMAEDFIEICDRNSESGHHTKKKKRKSFQKRLGSLNVPARDH